MQIMSEKIIKRLRTSAETLKLSEKELSDGRALLMALVKAPAASSAFASARESLFLKPRELAATRSLLAKYIHGQCTTTHRMTLRRAAAIISASLSMLAAGGGALAYAAESAVPSDLLYPIKIAINEPIIGLLHRTPEAQAAWAVKKFERRLHEVRALAERHDVQKGIENSVTVSIERAREEADLKTADVPDGQTKKDLRRSINVEAVNQEHFLRKLVDEGVPEHAVIPLIRATRGEAGEDSYDFDSSGIDSSSENKSSAQSKEHHGDGASSIEDSQKVFTHGQDRERKLNHEDKTISSDREHLDRGHDPAKRKSDKSSLETTSLPIEMLKKAQSQSSVEKDSDASEAESSRPADDLLPLDLKEGL